MDIEKEIASALKGRAASRILIQAPEGLKTQVLGIAKIAEKKGFEAIVWAEPCFGACDIPDYAAKALGCDLILHIGHAPMGVKSEVPVVYAEYPYDKNLKAIVEKNIRALNGFEKIGLLATVQHVGEINRVKEALEKAGKKTVIGRAKSLKYAGQILGCNADAAKAVEKDADAFLVLASGEFHASGVVKMVSKPVFVCDFEKEKITDISDKRALLEKRKIMLISKFNDAKTACILVSSKKGQMPKKGIFGIKKKIESLGKSVSIVAMDYISEEKLLGMSFDILVNCACPRIEDDLVFNAPVISANSLGI